MLFKIVAIYHDVYESVNCRIVRLEQVLASTASLYSSFVKLLICHMILFLTVSLILVARDARL